MILPSQFFDLLDCLAGQFFTTRPTVLCTGKDFGVQLVSDAKDYFSVAIKPVELPGNRAVLGVLLDDSAHIGSRKGYTLAIYIDVSKIDGKVFGVFSSIILAHEICHFAYYYELFIKLGAIPVLLCIIILPIPSPIS
jgi:hypothetical protein